MKKNKELLKKKKKLLIIFICFIAVIIIADWIISVVMYKIVFDKRFERDKAFLLKVEDFEGLKRTKHEIFSSNNQKLVGYMYSLGSNQHGVIIMAHGFGAGGHNPNMECANYFAKHGYYVFGFDATGNDESEGEGVGGLSQGVVDLDNVIDYIEKSKEYGKLPIGLFGQSWGGYCAGTVLNYHPEVKGFISCSGFNSSTDIIEMGGREAAGYVIYAMLPFVKLHELIKFGERTTNTVMDGFEKTDAKVMIVHSKDDKKVPMKYGYNIYYDKYKDDSRFEFISFDDRGHDNVFNDPTLVKKRDEYLESIDKKIEKWRESLDYDTKENEQRYKNDRIKYVEKNIDRKKLSNRIDKKLFDKFVKFYDDCMK